MENTNNASATIITGRRTRLSYANLFEPKGFDGSKPKYSVSLIIPKDDSRTLELIRSAISAAYQNGQHKLRGTGKTVPALEDIDLPLNDGDKSRPNDPAYANSWYINAKSDDQPKMFDEQRNPVIDRSLLTGYRHETWDLGDRVTVYDKELGINVKTRVVRREYNLQEPWKSKLELSSTLKNLSSSSSTWDSAVAATEGTSLVSSVDIKDMVPFNHLKNSRADDGFAHWANNGFVVDTENGASGSACFKATGVLNGTKSLSQVVYPATRDNYTFSAKVASDNIELSDGGAVTLEIEITYDDGSVESKEYDLY